MPNLYGIRWQVCCSPVVYKSFLGITGSLGKCETSSGTLRGRQMSRWVGVYDDENACNSIAKQALKGCKWTPRSIWGLTPSWQDPPWPWSFYRNGAQLGCSLDGLIAMWQLFKGGEGRCVHAFVCVCVHFFFFYSCTLEWHPGATLRRAGLFCFSLSCCQARWLLSLREEEERWKEEGKGERSKLALTELEWSVPRAATSGDHQQLARTASSLPSSFLPKLTFSLPDWGSWSQWWQGCV